MFITIKLRYGRLYCGELFPDKAENYTEYVWMITIPVQVL